MDDTRTAPPCDVDPEAVCREGLGGIPHVSVSFRDMGAITAVTPRGHRGSCLGIPVPRPGDTIGGYLAQLGVPISPLDPCPAWLHHARAMALGVCWETHPACLYLHTHAGTEPDEQCLEVHAAPLHAYLTAMPETGGACYEVLVRAESQWSRASSERSLFRAAAELLADDSAFSVGVLLLHQPEAPQHLFRLTQGDAQPLPAVAAPLDWHLPPGSAVLYDRQGWCALDLPHRAALPDTGGLVVLVPFGEGESESGLMALASPPGDPPQALELYTLARAVGSLGLRLATIRACQRMQRQEDNLSRLHQGLERMVAEKTAELRQTNRYLESFTSMVSHDLRAPLQTISALAELLQKQYENEFPDEALNVLGMITEGSLHAGRLIDALLRLSRVAQRDIEPATVDTGAVVQAVARELAVTDEVVAVGSLPPCYADEALLHQVFFNLIGNAVKFAGQHGAPRVRVGHEMQGDETVYYVHDNGPGLDPEMAEHIFAPFRRGHSDASIPGEGIGLAIAERIVVRHRGRIWAETKPEGGACLCFTLALAPET